VISGRDVTELKRLEEQLIQAEKLAAMGQMLAGVAHELNNPLTAILGVTELLREKTGFEESAKRQLDLTHRQARRAARIVQNLLEFSRPASPQKKPLDVNSLIERTLQLHEHSLRRNAVEVDFRPQPDLPGVIGDGNQLIQVFLNLVTNAEQAIREVRDTGRIQIRIARAEDRLSVTVQDDGVGIKPEAIPRIFDPFYTTKRPGGGTGLGLSICMSIVREHGGTIEAEALPGGGSAFIVYLPIARDLPPEDAAPGASASARPATTGSAAVGSLVAGAGHAHSGPTRVPDSSDDVLTESRTESTAPRARGDESHPALPGAGTHPSHPVPVAHSGASSDAIDAAAASAASLLAGRNILILDDEESIRMLLDEGLSAQGMNVFTASSAEEALRLVPQRRYHAFLCDLNLSALGPAASGRESATKILAAAQAPPPVLIYITGEYVEDPPSVSPAEPRRLQKPFRVSDVVAVLQQLLGQKAN
jgi:CheY-like chemotaxis protein/PAS domain-containing protein